MVLGHGREEMMAVHLITSYCLTVLLYGCEIWQMSASYRHKINVGLNKSFKRKNLIHVGVRVLNRFCFIVTC